MNIYAVEGGAYSDRYLEGYCTTKENADHVIARLNSEHKYTDFRIIEIECIDNLAVHKKIRYKYTFYSDLLGKHLIGDSEYRVGTPVVEEHYVIHNIDYYRNRIQLVMTLEDEDYERAKKIAQDEIAKIVAALKNL